MASAKEQLVAFFKECEQDRDTPRNERTILELADILVATGIFAEKFAKIHDCKTFSLLKRFKGHYIEPCKKLYKAT